MKTTGFYTALALAIFSQQFGVNAQDYGVPGENGFGGMCCSSHVEDGAFPFALKSLIGTTVMIPIFLLGEITCIRGMGIVLMGGQKDGKVIPIVNSMFLLAGV
ncbi:hypothetical protein PTNB29_00941 [Pyrenophora teres f. teres]|nr:hypothetical protein PTNB29_00941 [Pyrenophora teres f. teres]